MIVIRKKRIVCLISMLVISVLVISVNGDIYGSDTSSSGTTVILDAGHGEPDGGAVSNSRSF